MRHWRCQIRGVFFAGLIGAGLMACTDRLVGKPISPLEQKQLSPAVLEIAQKLVKGHGRLNILYFGNSRVVGGHLPPPKTRGFCLAGCQPHTRDRGLLVGTGFINPCWQPANAGALFSSITTDGTPVHELSEAVQLNTTSTQGVRLAAKQQITTSGVVPTGPLTARDTLSFTVIYRRGPDEGTFVMTPLSGETASTMKPLSSSARSVAAGATGGTRAAFVTISIPGVVSGTVVRGLEITGAKGNSHIYELHASTDASDGFVVGRIAVGGQGYPNQMRTTQGKAPRCKRQDFVTHIESFDPDVVILQYASNQLSQILATDGDTGWVKAARELLGRVREARKKKPFLTILQLDHPTPFKHSAFVVSWGMKDILSVQALEQDCLVANPGPRLPGDWPPEGTEQQSKYFRDAVHENPLGARVVWDAVFADLTAIVAEMSRPPKAELGLPEQGPADMGLFDLMPPGQ